MRPSPLGGARLTRVRRGPSQSGFSIAFMIVEEKLTRHRDKLRDGSSEKLISGCLGIRRINSERLERSCLLRRCNNFFLCLTAAQNAESSTICGKKENPNTKPTNAANTERFQYRRCAVMEHSPRTTSIFVVPSCGDGSFVDCLGASEQAGPVSHFTQRRSSTIAREL